MWCGGGEAWAQGPQQGSPQNREQRGGWAGRGARVKLPNKTDNEKGPRAHIPVGLQQTSTHLDQLGNPTTLLGPGFSEWVSDPL